MTQKEYFKDALVPEGYLIIKAEPFLKSDLKIKLTGKELKMEGDVVKASKEFKEYEGMRAYWGTESNNMFERIYVMELRDKEKEDHDIHCLYYKASVNLISYFKPKTK